MKRHDAVEVTVIRRIDRKAPLRWNRKVGDFEINFETFNGRPLLRLTNARGFFLSVPMDCAVDVAKALDAGVSAFVAHEAAKEAEA